MQVRQLTDSINADLIQKIAEQQQFINLQREHLRDIRSQINSFLHNFEVSKKTYLPYSEPTNLQNRFLPILSAINTLVPQDVDPPKRSMPQQRLELLACDSFGTSLYISQATIVLRNLMRQLFYAGRNLNVLARNGMNAASTFSQLESEIEKTIDNGDSVQPNAVRRYQQILAVRGIIQEMTPDSLRNGLQKFQEILQRRVDLQPGYLVHADQKVRSLKEDMSRRMNDSQKGTEDMNKFPPNEKVVVIGHGFVVLHELAATFSEVFTPKDNLIEMASSFRTYRKKGGLRKNIVKAMDEGFARSDLSRNDISLRAFLKMMNQFPDVDPKEYDRVAAALIPYLREHPEICDPESVLSATERNVINDISIRWLEWAREAIAANEKAANGAREQQ